MTRALPVLLLALAACDEDSKNDESVWPYCEDTEAAITLDEETPIGATGSDLLSHIPESSTGQVTWSDGAQSPLSLGFSADLDTLRFVESAEVYPEPEEGQDVPSIAVECPDYVAADGTLSLQSEDGQLDEALSLTLALDEYDLAEPVVDFYTELDADALGGTLLVSDHVTASDYDTVRLFLSGTFRDGTFSGELQAQGEGTDGDIAFAENITIATFGGE